MNPTPRPAINPVPRDIGAWRHDQRATLIEARLAVPIAERVAVGEEIAAELTARVNAGPNTTISLYWPFRGEIDLRPLMLSMHERGCRIALPVVVAKARPLVFREWSPGCAMDKGVWNIPIPADGPEIEPSVTIAPLVGYDPSCYRLGYGGGFFDRTLAAARRKPLVIGVGLPSAALPTIHPQPHDIPMDLIVTGKGRVIERVES
ncbi:MAG: 5-formyltetrahydrofolate cyclo-ligase [Rhodospirillales bacterium]